MPNDYDHLTAQCHRTFQKLGEAFMTSFVNSLLSMRVYLKESFHILINDASFNCLRKIARKDSNEARPSQRFIGRSVLTLDDHG